MPLALGMVPEGERAAVLDALVAGHSRAPESHDLRRGGLSLRGGRAARRRAIGCAARYAGADRRAELRLHPRAGRDFAYRGLGRRPLAGPLYAGQRRGVVLSRAGWNQRGSFARGARAAGCCIRRWWERLQWVRAHYESALGQIESDWHRGAAETVYNFTIPANATATIEIDSAAAGMATVNGAALAHAMGAA